MCAEELDPNNSWEKNGDTIWSQRGGLRSRYSGYPLEKDKMVVTILSQGSFSFGHQAISFEWAHNENENSYRKHKTFHLYPIEGSSALPDELGMFGSAKSVVPGRIERLRNDNKETFDVKGEKITIRKSAEKGKAASDKEAASSFLTKNGRYRSWVVDFKMGFMAFEKAKAQWKVSDCTPKFNLIGSFGGKNCGTWVQSIAALAGIPSTSFKAKIGYPVPRWEVEGGADIKTEMEMWDSRKKLKQ